MTTGIENISDELWLAKNWKVVTTVLIITDTIAEKLNEKPETIKALDDRMNKAFSEFAQELMEDEKNAKT